MMTMRSMSDEPSRTSPLRKGRKIRSRTAAGVSAVLFLAASVYALTLPAPFSIIAAAVFLCSGATLLVFAIAHFRLSRGNPLRQALLDYPGMRANAKERRSEERTRETAAIDEDGSAR